MREHSDGARYRSRYRSAELSSKVRAARQRGDRIGQRGAKVICPTTDLPNSCQSLRPKIIRLFRSANQVYVPLHPALMKRGASRSSRNVGAGCDGRIVAFDEAHGSGRQRRVVLSPRCWGQAGGDVRQRRRQSKPGLRGEPAISRKPIAQGMPDRFGVPVVTNSYAFYPCIRGRGCAERPAFPVPSVFGGRMIEQNSGVRRREIAV
jgi:hypothetical protein